MLFEAAVFGLSKREGTKRCEQVVYLSDFLEQHDVAKPGCFVVEQPYVDRHYMEEYSAYYSTSFTRVSPHAARIHFFTERWKLADLEALFAEAGTEEGHDSARTRLQDAYVGFVVVRPIAAAPIGRTVLRPYGSDAGARVMEVAEHVVHLGGLTLTVRGVPFQQQEVAVGACATTAIWSALAAASRMNGFRAPTPFAITEAATRHVINDRPLPAEGGLDFNQVLGGMRALGFSPYALRAARLGAEFTVAVRTYLNSGIPVVLLLNDRMDYHAVTAIGFRRSDEPLTINIGVSDPSAVVRCTGMDLLYVHEDRLGPYARMRWLVPDHEPELVKASEPREVVPFGRRIRSRWPRFPRKHLTRFLGRKPDEPDVADVTFRSDTAALVHEPKPGARYVYGTAPMTVYAAIVPLYPKMRLSARGLLSVAAEVHAWLSIVAKSADVLCDFWFWGGARYVSSARALRLGTRFNTLAMKVALPRYIGVIRFRVNGIDVLDVLCDTTDVHRGIPELDRVVALIALDEGYRAAAEQLVEKHRLRVAVI